LPFFSVLLTVVFICLGSGATHEPPSTLVMKEQRWFVASEMVTQLLNNNGEVKS
jgi:lamin B